METYKRKRLIDCVLTICTLSLCLWLDDSKAQGVSEGEEDSQLVPLDCKSFCTCRLVVKNYPKEYRVNCTGTGLENAVVTSSLFETEDTPDIERQVYVLLQKFKSVQITEDFLSKWLAYKSCSLDLWHIGESHFPQVAPPRGNSTALLFFFAGIGLAFTNVPIFPSNLFDEKVNAQITSQHSNIGEIDLGLVQGSAKGFINFNISHSTIGVLRSSIPIELITKTSINAFQIRNSMIGILEKGGLNFIDNDYRPNALIENSTIGIVKEGSIRLRKSVGLAITKSTIGHLAYNSAIKLEPESRFELTENKLNLYEESLSDIVCSDNRKISLNQLSPLDFDMECELQNASEKCPYTFDELDYIHPLCGKNIFLTPAAVKEISPILSVDDKTSKNYIKLPRGILYIFIAASSALLLMVFVLAALLACRKASAGSNLQQPTSPHPFFDSSTPVYFSAKSHLGPSVAV